MACQSHAQGKCCGGTVSADERPTLANSMGDKGARVRGVPRNLYDHDYSPGTSADASIAYRYPLKDDEDEPWYEWVQTAELACE